MFNLKNKLLLVITWSFLLLGCAAGPADLGINKLKWESYSEEKKKELLNSYERLSEDREKAISQEKNGESKESNVFLDISMRDGEIMFPPLFVNWQLYEPVRFNIHDGQCKDVEIVSKKNKKTKSSLLACFRDKVLYLDPSYYDEAKKDGTASIYFSPLWLTGFTYYGISSDGYVRLKNVSLRVEQKTAAKKTE